MFSILVPTDFSDCSSNALNYAISFADAFGATMTILHATGTNNSSATQHKNEQECRDALEQIQQSINKQHPNINCQTKINKGYAIAEIYDAAISGDFDILIMGTHGSSRTADFHGIPFAFETMFGSVTAALVGHSTIPILAIHSKEKFEAPKEFVLLSDFHSMPSSDSYKFLSLLASKFDSKVTIVYIENKPTYLSEAFEEMNKIEGLFKGIQFEYKVVKATDIENTLLNMPLENHQILSVISKEKSGLEELLGVSVSHVLVNYLDASLLILPEYIAVYPTN